MTSFAWWRSWHGAPTDHKWAVIAARAGVKVGIVSAVAWALLDYASQQEDRGSVAGFDTEEYAVYSGFDQAAIEAILQAMNDRGVIVDGRLANWEKRQPKREDPSKERMRKLRDVKLNVTQSDAERRTVTLSDAPEEEEDLRLTEKEEEEDAPPSNPLLAAFVQYAQVPDFGTGNAGEAVRQMTAAGVTPADIQAAVAWMDKEHRTIRSITSIVGPAITEAGKRKRNGKAASPPATNWDNIDPDLYYIRLNGHKASKALMDSAWKRLVDNGVQIPDEYRRQYRQRFGPPYGEPGYVPVQEAGAEGAPAPTP